MENLDPDKLLELCRQRCKGNRVTLTFPTMLHVIQEIRNLRAENKPLLPGFKVTSALSRDALVPAPAPPLVMISTGRKPVMSSKRALRLHEKHTRAELVQLQERIKEENDGTGEGLHRYNKRARQMLDNIGWAIYWHGAPQGNTRMAQAKPKSKWW